MNTEKNRLSNGLFSMYAFSSIRSSANSSWTLDMKILIIYFLRNCSYLSQQPATSSVNSTCSPL